ncbi:conserved hypothetical protein [Culex quinquefasciatus]|uniref:Chitin-binding type-2 domain-containing protein n=1 Tax=Culex quinquefasciatus TaxID=7176 RepID=B0XA71_CULQU|nr:conserved hypothetical protein [Culex quinquefasciatus]|eukprot:XP_001866543.1 conserved hypothetical protein [Culex quinquefasciatus]
MFSGRFVVGWLGLLVLTGYVQSAIPLGQLGRASSKARTNKLQRRHAASRRPNLLQHPERPVQIVIFAVLLALVAMACAKPASSKENTSTNVCKGQKDGTKFPDMKNCSKYIRCEKSKETSKSCGGSKSFDAVSLTCVKSSGAVCFQAPTSELPIIEDPIPSRSASA